MEELTCNIPNSLETNMFVVVLLLRLLLRPLSFEEWMHTVRWSLGHFEENEIPDDEEGDEDAKIPKSCATLNCPMSLEWCSKLSMRICSFCTMTCNNSWKASRIVVLADDQVVAKYGIWTLMYWSSHCFASLIWEWMTLSGNVDFKQRTFIVHTTAMFILFYFFAQYRTDCVTPFWEVSYIPRIRLRSKRVWGFGFQKSRTLLIARYDVVLIYFDRWYYVDLTNTTVWSFPCSSIQTLVFHLIANWTFEVRSTNRNAG